MKLASRDKKFLLAGAATAVLVLLYVFGDRLLPNRGVLSKDLELKRKVLQKYRETLGQEKNYSSRLEQYRQRLRQDQMRVLPGENPSLAAAELQKLLTDLAVQNGVDVVRKDIQREQKMQDNLIKIFVRIETNCTPEQLTQFLAAIENYEKPLTVDELTINSYRLQKKFEIRPIITVSGYILGPEVKPEPKSATNETRTGN